MRVSTGSDNKIFAPIAFVLLWSAQVAMAIERWRRVSGRHIREWIDTVGEFEALCSLAGYSYEHPADVFPELALDASPAAASKPKHWRIR